jgi:hypothetical protein
MKLAVYLTCRTMHDRAGVEYVFRERRLVRKNDSDKVLAIVDAPPGTRVRTRPDEHGQEQLLVPRSLGFWSRIWGKVQVIPAKYVIDTARRGRYGLSLVSWELPMGEEEGTLAAGSPEK